MFEDYRVNVPCGESGDWKVSQFTVGDHDMKAVSYALHGRPVPPGTYTRLLRKGAYEPVMSDTPAEVSDHLGFIYRATGRCLVNGLGLGVVLKAILKKPDVTHVDVVELEQDVINLVWPTYKDHDRVTLHHADAYTIQWPKGTQWDYAWHDIWPDISTDNLPGIAKLKHKYAHAVKWQGAWVEGLIRDYRRRGM